MKEPLQTNSVEERRKLLKGALAGSVVMTLGYGGAAAAQSMLCVEKVNTNPPSSYPQKGFLFVTDYFDPPPASGSAWAWRLFRVYRNTLTPQPDSIEALWDGYHWYQLSPDRSDLLSPPLDSFTKVAGIGLGYVLVFFNYDGTELGTYPSHPLMVNTTYAPAAASCLTTFPAGTNDANFYDYSLPG